MIDCCLLQNKILKKFDLLVERRSSEFLELSPIELKHDVLWKSKNWTNIWILSGKIIYHPFHSKFFVEKGDFLKKTSVLNRILWKKKKNWNISLFTTNFTSTRNKSFIEKRKNLFCLLILNKKNKFKSSLSSNLFSPFKNLLSSFPMLRWQPTLKLTSVYFSKKTNYFNTETFFVEQDFKKTNIEKFCSSLFSSSTFSFVQIFVKNSKTRKKNFFSNLNIYWKNSSSCIKTKIENKQIFYKTKYLPFSLFFLNILSSSEQDLIQNKKLNKTKSDILFSKTFQKIFSFSYLQKQQNLSKKLFVNKIVYTSSKNNQKKIFRIKLLLQKNNNRYLLNQKKYFQQIFLKFSTSHRTISFFRFSSFSKTFNISRKFVKMKSENNFLIFKKKFLLFKFSFLKDNLNTLLKKSKQFYATKKLFHEYKKVFNKNLSTMTAESQSDSQVVLRTHSQQNKQQFVEQKNKQLLQKFIFSSRLKLSFFKSLMFKNEKISQNFKQSQNFKENKERYILFKKTLLSFDYKKIRYNKYGYVFSFHNSLKNKSFTTQIENSFQIFNKLKQSFFDFKNTNNPGKQQTNISFANGNFIGKDFPTFFTYFFPKNYQTMTNGIFTILSFENNSKKQRYKQFCCFQQRKNSLFLKDHSKKPRKNKKRDSFLQKK